MAKMNNSGEKSHSFGRGMLIYALVFLIIASAGLAWFYVKMAAYERARPSYVIDNYIDSLTIDDIKSLSAGYLDDISRDIQSEDECVQLLSDMIKNSKAVKNIKESNDYELTYYLKYNDTLVEKLILTLGKEDKYGYTPWALKSDEILFDNIINEKTFVLAPGCTVEVGGVTLDKSHLIDDCTPYSLLKDFYSKYDNLPHNETWDTGKYLGDLAVVITDSSGNEIDESAEASDDYEDNCTSSEKAEIEELMDKYIEAYVTFTSGTNDNPYSNYYMCSQYVVYGSELQERLHDAIGGLGFASSLGDKIESITVNRCMKIGDDMYAADVTYVVTTTGSNGMVSTNDYNGIYILSRDEDGNLLAENETTY